MTLVLPDNLSTALTQRLGQWITTYPTWQQALDKLLSLTAKPMIKLLPDYALNDRKIVVVNANNMDDAITQLSACRWLGFDTESRPNFHSSDNFSISLLQLATPQACYLFHINDLNSFTPLAPILESERIVKVGIGLRSDSSDLRNHHNVNLVKSLDLVSIFKRLGRKKGAGAKHLTATLFNQHLHKSKRLALSNWSNSPLTDRQCQYAAEDAMVALDCLLFLQALTNVYGNAMPSWLHDTLRTGELPQPLQNATKKR